jgi:malate dehydrogenase (oxaloacetate-decarboxylating)(NADP+)
MLQLSVKLGSIYRCYYKYISDKGPMFLSDTAINIDPTADDLAKLSMMTGNRQMFGVEPVIAMVSFSNFGSSTDPSAAK